ncbi:hypothetical protein BLNAU_6891 [Blattamonas nauphoetae]|uniref:Uncharacterized protein n=1 Tax=Blattamonas nauphoetae TaxID=2049346 RepID=A0ABQ9Y366_9EUKA|nr:hypothetical protein BLNAU_6891 [Blattamonas nauphoetae]
MGSEQSTLDGEHLHEHENGERGGKTSNISSLLKRLKRDDESILVDTLQELQKVASQIVDSLFLRYKDLIVSTFDDIDYPSPLPSVRTTCARISLFPHLRIAFNADDALNNIIDDDPHALTLLPSPIFPSSSPSQQYSGLSFLAALTKKRRTKYTKLTKNDRFIITRSLDFCSHSFRIPTLLLAATPPIEVDSEIIRELLLFVKEALTTILSNISYIDPLIAFLPSDSSPTTPFFSGVDKQVKSSLTLLRNQCEEFVSKGWAFLFDSTFYITEPHKPSFQTIILDDLSFPDLILNSLKLKHKDIRKRTIKALSSIVTETLSELTDFISSVCDPIGDDDDQSEQYLHIRASVFEPAKPFIIFIFNNSDKLVLSENYQFLLTRYLNTIFFHTTEMELRSDEHDADVVSALVKWETRTMVEMESEEHFDSALTTMLNRTSEWNEDKPEQQKRREV